MISFFIDQRQGKLWFFQFWAGCDLFLVFSGGWIDSDQIIGIITAFQPFWNRSTDKKLTVPDFCLFQFSRIFPGFVFFDAFCDLTGKDIGIRTVADAACGICGKGAACQPKKFFESMLEYAMEIGMKGLGYLKGEGELAFSGPIDKFLDDNQRCQLADRTGIREG